MFTAHRGGHFIWCCVCEIVHGQHAHDLCVLIEQSAGLGQAPEPAAQPDYSLCVDELSWFGDRVSIGIVSPANRSPSDDGRDKGGGTDDTALTQARAS